MNKDFLIGILSFSLIVVISGVLMIAIFFPVPATSDTFKAMNFEGITVSVPDNSNFVADTTFIMMLIMVFLLSHIMLQTKNL